MSTRKRLRQAVNQMQTGWAFVDGALARLASRTVSDDRVVIGDKMPDGTAFRIVERAMLPFYAGVQLIA